MSIREKEQRGEPRSLTGFKIIRGGRGCGVALGGAGEGAGRVAAPCWKQAGYRVNKGRPASLRPCAGAQSGRKVGVHAAAGEAPVRTRRLWFLGAARLPALWAPPAPLLKAGVEAGPWRLAFPICVSLPSPLPSGPGTGLPVPARVLGTLSVSRGWGLEGSASSEWSWGQWLRAPWAPQTVHSIEGCGLLPPTPLWTTTTAPSPWITQHKTEFAVQSGGKALER